MEGLGRKDVKGMGGGFERERESTSICMVTLRDFYFGREVVFYARVACQVLFVLLSLFVFLVSFSRRRHLSW